MCEGLVMRGEEDSGCALVGYLSNATPHLIWYWLHGQESGAGLSKYGIQR